MTYALQIQDHEYKEHPLSAGEVTTVAAICNRLGRMLGTVDRDGIFSDFEIVQAHCPLDLAALAAAPDRVFVEEISAIIDAADRGNHRLSDTFSSRFASGETTTRLF